MEFSAPIKQRINFIYVNSWSFKNLAGFIDHTLLRADAAKREISLLCKEAGKYGFKTVCVAPCRVGLCKKLLKGSGVKVCAVIGFPLGSSTTETKAFEARDAVRNGADEIDMVANIGALKSGDLACVLRDVKEVRKAIRNKILKLIIETCCLTRREKVLMCRVAKRAEVDFVKTSTGFGPKGAVAADVRLIRKILRGSIGVKASGGIKTYSDFKKMIKAGADRIGTSASVKIMKEVLKTVSRRS
ncbi:MAG: deoxyribose-phosphate aldolase [Elusimicrobiota bacterium]